MWYTILGAGLDESGLRLPSPLGSAGTGALFIFYHLLSARLFRQLLGIRLQQFLNRAVIQFGQLKQSSRPGQCFPQFPFSGGGTINAQKPRDILLGVSRLFASAPKTHSLSPPFLIFYGPRAIMTLDFNSTCATARRSRVRPA